MSLAAGPVGRNAEAAGAASLKGVAGIFSYSKTKGLFAGVSLEGSGIMERRDANEKMYGTRYTALQLLSGQVQPPPQAASLMSILNSRVFAGMRMNHSDDSMYNDMPIYDDHNDEPSWNGGRRGNSNNDRDDGFGGAQRSNTWQDDVYDRPGGHGAPSRSSTFASGRGGDDDFNSGRPGRPAAPKPNFGAKPRNLGQNEAVAMYNFDADQAGDLAFKKGDIVTVLKKTDSDNDWWYVAMAVQRFCGQMLTSSQDRNGWHQARHLPQQLC